MRKLKSLKIVLVMAICVFMILCATQSFAVNVTDLTSTIEDDTNSATINNVTTENTTTNTATTNSTTNTSLLNTTEKTNSVNNSVNNSVLKTNNTSNYNNSLPNTGVESSAPIALFVMVLAISAIYAYKKVQDYKNI